MNLLHFNVFFTLAVILLAIALLIIDKLKPSIVFIGAVAALCLGGIVSTQTFFLGLSNPSIISIFLLIIITAALNEYFNPSIYFDRLFKNTKSPQGFLLKMSAGIATVSSFMNNTPVVAMMMPYVYTWAKKNNYSPSKFLMPLSFAAISGGVITLIGTSTNLMLNGLLVANNLRPLGFLDFLIPGLLIAISTVIFLAVLAPKILPSSRDILDDFEENKRKYLIETRLSANAAIIGKSIEQAGLRNLEGAFVSAILRGEKQILPVGPDEILEANDVLLFAGETGSIMELINKGLGLEPDKKRDSTLGESGEFLEAVVAQNSGLDRKTVKQISFREKYDAAIIGIHRKGEKLHGKIGGIDIKTGDLLLLATGTEFDKRNGQNEDLIVINKMEKLKSLSKNKKNIFWGGAIIAIILALIGIFTLFETLLFIVSIQAILGMVKIQALRKSISFDLLVVLISSLCIGQALIDSGASAFVANQVFGNAASWSPLVLVLAVFGATFLLTSVITNVAAISIIFPVVLSLSAVVPQYGHLLFVTTAFAASCCFVTPFAYQTNLMVVELGNYRFIDFFKLGLPLAIIYAMVFLAYEMFNYQLL